jgi:GTP cyclohydrolase I
MAYKKTEQYDENVTAGLIKTYKESIDLLGEDSGREGLLKTPERMAKAMQFLTRVTNWMHMTYWSLQNFMKM